MTSTTTNTTQTTKLLTLLQQYEILHTTANDNLKSSIFNITKARKFGSSSSGQQYSPDDVREELRACALVELQDDVEVDGDVDDIEPNLVQEDVSGDDDDGVKISGGISKGSRKFVLHLDGMREVEKQQTDTTGCLQIDDETIGADNIESDGLRRRRKGKTDDTISSSEDNSSSSDKNKWTIEDETPNDTSNNDDEEKRLQSADPINLFGVPPPALKVAQTKSRYAIAYYVEVANLAREIMNITNQD